jgi:hypothetical protein
MFLFQRTTILMQNTGPLKLQGKEESLDWGLESFLRDLGVLT